MANITMSDYVGFIFSEIIRARVIADAESRRIAEAYANDDVLKHFSVPRFKIPEMDLSIPVIVSNAKFSNLFAFTPTENEFINALNGKVDNAINELKIKRGGIRNIFNNNIRDFILPVRPLLPVNPVVPVFPINPVRLTNTNIPKKINKKANSKNTVQPTAAPSQKGNEILVEFYDLLQNNHDKTNFDNILEVKWAQFFKQKLEIEENLKTDYERHYPQNELYLKYLADVYDYIKKNTIITATKMENLLVDPETNVVKNTATDTTVFLINAKIVEEGVFVKSIKDKEGNELEKVVEFD